MDKKECIMLAAGLSSRMGKWKMVMPWGAGTLLDSALSSALSVCDRVILVTGYRGDELSAYYQDDPAVEIVHNADYASGMFSSVQCGVASVRSRYFFLALGDMPEVSPEVYLALWRDRQQDAVIIPASEWGKGHPVLLPHRAKALISSAGADSTLKEIIHQMRTRTVDINEGGIHWDVDTSEQYHQLIEKTFAKQ